jgi:hypothetical protein
LGLQIRNSRGSGRQRGNHGKDQLLHIMILLKIATPVYTPFAPS